MGQSLSKGRAARVSLAINQEVLTLRFTAAGLWANNTDAELRAMR